jgi:hypothetical protein
LGPAPPATPPLVTVPVPTSIRSCSPVLLKPTVPLVKTTEAEDFPGFPDGIMGPDLMNNVRPGGTFRRPPGPHHGFTSLAVVAGAVGVLFGLPLADPIVGLLISVAILVLLWGTVRSIGRRLTDSTEPELTNRAPTLCKTAPAYSPSLPCNRDA